jgi:hypothetical protein
MDARTHPSRDSPNTAIQQSRYATTRQRTTTHRRRMAKGAITTILIRSYEPAGVEYTKGLTRACCASESNATVAALRFSPLPSPAIIHSNCVRCVLQSYTQRYNVTHRTRTHYPTTTTQTKPVLFCADESSRQHLWPTFRPADDASACARVSRVSNDDPDLVSYVKWNFGKLGTEASSEQFTRESYSWEWSCVERRRRAMQGE